MFICYDPGMAKTKKSNIHKAVGYLRVSTTVQADDGFGLDVQRASIIATADSLGIEIVAWCEDAAVSGTKDALDRAGFNCLVRHLLDGDADTVLIHHGDRLARNLTVHEAALAVLWSHGAHVYIGGELVQADDPSDPIRTMVRQILGAVNEYARKDAMLKMHGGRKSIRKSDPTRYIGGATIPFGCAVEDGRLVAGQELIEQVDTIVAGRATGMSWAAIGRPLGLLTHQVKRRLEVAVRLGLLDADLENLRVPTTEG